MPCMGSTCQTPAHWHQVMLALTLNRFTLCPDSARVTALLPIRVHTHGEGIMLTLLACALTLADIQRRLQNVVIYVMVGMQRH